MLFGPGAKKAIETYQAAKAGDDKQLLGALVLNLATDRIITKFKVENDTAIGWADDGEEVARVPLKEPTMVRPEFDGAAGAYRYNVT
jgi:nitrate reductase beta subunit